MDSKHHDIVMLGFPRPNSESTHELPQHTFKIESEKLQLSQLSINLFVCSSAQSMLGCNIRMCP